LLPKIAVSSPAQTTECEICRINSETGATGLEPATSGVTGLFHRYNDWRRWSRNRSIRAGPRAICVDSRTIAQARFRAFAALLLPRRCTLESRRLPASMILRRTLFRPWSVGGTRRTQTGRVAWRLQVRARSHRRARRRRRSWRAGVGRRHRTSNRHLGRDPLVGDQLRAARPVPPVARSTPTRAWHADSAEEGRMPYDSDGSEPPSSRAARRPRCSEADAPRPA
jgi:hypothetical protein